MTQQEAIKLVDKIKEMCNEQGIWFSVTFDHKPKLNMIKINEISIKIDDKK